MYTLALDIGGANLKAVLGKDDGQADWETPDQAPPAPARVGVRAFPLWRDPGPLADHLSEMVADWPTFDRIVATTTAELCDCFATKREGVGHVIRAVQTLARNRPCWIWLTDGRFAEPEEARRRPFQAAAANWHAQAHYLAKRFNQGVTLLADVGSTTSDLIPLRDGRCKARGLTDMQRLATGELLYTGAMRTPLAALGPTIPFAGQNHHVMAEFFATTADVYVLTGDTPQQPEVRDTPDHRPLTIPFAAARVLRMIGADLEMLDVEAAKVLAMMFAKRQQQRIAQGMGQVLRGQSPDRVIVSGSGAFIARAAWRVWRQQQPSRQQRPIGGGSDDPIQKADDKQGANVAETQVIDLSKLIGEEGSAAACALTLWRLAQTGLT